ncbi:ATP-binding protein [Brevundimonas sp.]|uniref:ATP-binding protein n=1 Tax=Brevundimonas sp. TaxID=1871086 RepID=UPI0028B11D52|nr:ATP-binding protein [Brevundimonas sp.]
MTTMSAAFVAGPRPVSASALSFGRSGRRSRLRPARPRFPTPTSAFAALIDNALDARAGHVAVVVREDADGGVAALAVLDDGVGMVPEMIRAACAPGASCRLGDGPHFARDGQGLPAAPFALGDRFTLWSRPARGSFCAVAVSQGLTGPVAPASPMELPVFLPPGPDGSAWRTVLIIEPRRDLGPASALRRRLRSDLGFLFSRLSRRVTLSVDSVPLRARRDFARLGPSAELAGPYGLVTLSSIFSTSARPVATDGVQRWGLIGARLGRRLGPLGGNPLWRPLDADRRWRLDLDFSPDADAVLRPCAGGLELDPAVWSWLGRQGLTTVMTRLRDAST